MIKNRKTLLLSAILTVAVISGISAFSFVDNSPNIIVNEKHEDNLSVKDSVSVEQNFVDENTQREAAPYSSSTESNSNEPTLPGSIDVRLSHMPLLNEITNVTATAENLYDNEEDVVFFIENGWEFVNVPESEIETFVDKNNNTAYKITESFSVEKGKSETFTKQIKPTKLGINYVMTYFISSGNQAIISLFIGEDKTITLEQYYKENPELAPWNNIPEKEPCVYEDCVGPDFNTTHPPVSSSTPTPEEIEIMKKLGEWPPINGTSDMSSEPGASGASGTITIHGFIKNQPSRYSEATNIYISDVNVCAWDYDNLIVKQKLGCDYTENGYFKLLNMPNTDADGTTLDLYFTLSTNSQHSSIVDSSGDFYILTLPTENNIPNRNFFLSETIDSTGTLEETKYHRAFGITDTIADARTYLSYNNQNVDKINVKWQHDAGTHTFFPNEVNRPDGAFYLRSSDTMYLDGIDNSRNRDDDSEQRFTILHEWGHHQMHDVFSGWPNACVPQAHFITSPNTAGCAWKEGWADFMPFLIDNVHEYTISPGLSYNVEEDSVILSGTLHKLVNMTNNVDVGQTVEGHIAGALWDIYDGIGTGTYEKRGNVNKDTLALGFDEIQLVFAKEDTTFNGFYDQWKLDYPTSNDIDDIMYLHHMGFYTLPVTPPTGSIFLYDDFEGTLDKWTITADGSRNWGIISDRTSVEAVDANNHIVSSKNCDNNCFMVSDTIDTTSYTQIEFDKYVHFNVDRTEGLKVEVSTNDGTTWTEIATYTEDNGHNTTDWTTETLDISSYQSSTFKVKFTGMSSSNNEVVSVDDVKFLGSATTGTISQNIYDDFEGTLSLWTLTAQDDDDWEITTFDIDSTSGNHVVVSGNCDRECYMVSGIIDTSSSPTLEFKRNVSSFVDRGEGLKVYVSSNNGINWTEIAFYSDDNNKNDSTWHTETIDISAHQSNMFKIKFTGISSSSSEKIYIDDVSFPSGSSITHVTSYTYNEVFDDLRDWTKSGTNNFNVVTSWNEDWPDNAAPGDKILAANNCIVACVITSSNIDLSSLSSATMEVSRFVDRSLDNSEYLVIEVYNGRTWSELVRYTDNNNQDTDMWELQTFDITRYIDDDFKIRISTQQDRTNEDVGIDFIRISS